jgi:hypothetical protein
MRQKTAHGARLMARAIGAALSLVITLPLDTIPLRAQPAPAPAAATDETTAFSAGQLDALLAPIALYPDPLLTQLLMAATEPLQIVQAKRWLDDPAHAGLKGDALTKALTTQSWDPSVKSLVPFPQVLDMLNSKLDWTQQLGYAFATQQADVLASVQRLRRQAQSAGHLQSSPSSRPTRRWSTCPATIRWWSTAHGRIRPIRPWSCRRRPAMRSAPRWRRASRSAPGWRSPRRCGIWRRRTGAGTARVMAASTST